MHVSLWNVALQAVNFMVLAWLLQRFLFKPVRAVIAKRQAAVDAIQQQASAKEVEARRIMEDYRAKCADIAREAERARGQALAAAEHDAARLREEGNREARAAVERARADVERERTEAMRALEVRAADLGASIAERLLRDVLPDSDAPFLWRTTANIDALEASRKSTLARQLADGGAHLVSSRPLDQATRERFEQWLSALASKRIPTSYAVDAGLIAGVELRLSTGVWRSHWRGAIERIRADLQSHEAAA